MRYSFHLAATQPAQDGRLFINPKAQCFRERPFMDHLAPNDGHIIHVLEN